MKKENKQGDSQVAGANRRMRAQAGPLRCVFALACYLLATCAAPLDAPAAAALILATLAILSAR